MQQLNLNLMSRQYNSSLQSLLANGFEPLLVTDEDNRFERRSSASDLRNLSPAVQHNQSGNRITVQHINTPASRYNSGSGQYRNRNQNGSNNNANAYRHRDRRPSSNDARRNWGHVVQQRPFSGNCFICGKLSSNNIYLYLYRKFDIYPHVPSNKSI